MELQNKLKNKSSSNSQTPTTFINSNATKKIGQGASNYSKPQPSAKVDSIYSNQIKNNSNLNQPGKSNQANNFTV